MKKILFKDREVTLLGQQLNVGDKAPSFKAVKNDMSEFCFDCFKGEVTVITTFPSIDTSVCQLQAARFNQEASKFEGRVKIVTVSLDLPFALNRHCAANNISSAVTVSDYKEREFSTKYGLLIDEIKLIARSVYVVDKNGIIRYAEICDKVSSEPDYDKALSVITELLN